jgi:enamine deaminase RidA (YjgF/YER057c/UK114 family)
MTSGIQHMNPTGLHDPSHYGYTHLVMVPADTKLVYIAGQLGEDETGHAVAADFKSQLKQAFANLRTALAAVGATPEQVVKITILSVDLEFGLNCRKKQSVRRTDCRKVNRRRNLLTL